VHEILTKGGQSGYPCTLCITSYYISLYLLVGSITVQCLCEIRQVGKAANVVATFPSLDQKPKERVGCSKKLNCGACVCVQIVCMMEGFTCVGPGKLHL